MNEIICAVCKQGKGPKTCEICGFSDNGVINREFVTVEDANYWLETVVKPYRIKWEADKREVELLARIEKLEAHVIELQKNGTQLKFDKSNKADKKPSSTPLNEYTIGGTGQGGGIIFYHDPNGFIMTDTGEKAYYLEAATVNLGELTWDSSSWTPPNIAGTEYAIGTGRKNTALILAKDVAAPAALACKSYRCGGKDDWFLPSSDELNELYKQRGHVGIASGDFWSSSLTDRGYACYQHFSNGFQTNYINYSKFNVRAIRAF